jgi:hypothetical protein
MCFIIMHIKERVTAMKFNSRRFCTAMFTCLDTCNGPLRTQIHKQKSWGAKFCESGGQVTGASAVDCGARFHNFASDGPSLLTRAVLFSVPATVALRAHG